MIIEYKFEINMKHVVRLLGYTFGFVILLCSCSLEREPNDYINYKESYNNLKDARKWDNGIYSTLRGKFGGGYILPQEVQADMLNAHASYGNLYAAFHSWDLRSEDEALKTIYHSYYAALVDANVVISSAPLVNVLPEEEKIMDVFLGNAYFARAFYYFNLAIRWGVPYNTMTEATDLCVPLVKVPFSLERYARATNKDVYSLIINDLEIAEDKLSSVECKEGTDEITKDAVIALRARVYLYMGKMKEALDESLKLIESGRYPLIPALASGEKDSNGENNPFIQMWQYDSGKEQIWQPFVDKPNEVPTTTELYGADLSTWQYWNDNGRGDENYNKPSYMPSGTVIYEWFKDEDRRVPAYFEYVATTVNDQTDVAKIFVISKYKGNPKFSTLDSKQWGGYVPNGICAPKPFRIAEQYLIAAEAAYEINKEADAVKYINALKNSRGLNAVSTTGSNLLNDIREERSRELAYEGFRLWDLRRWKMPINGRKRQGQLAEYPVPERFFASGYDYNKVIPADNPKFIWGFPKDEVSEINKKVKQNIGW